MTPPALSRRALLYGSPMVAGAALTAGVTGGTPAAAAVAATTAASPKDAPYNAVGDGVADDTAAINQCIADNRVVDFGGPQNVYRITDTVYVNQSAPRHLIADGATLLAGGPVTMMRFLNAAHRVRGLTFDGGAGRSGVGLIVESSSPRSRVESCTFANTGWSGVIMNAAYGRVAGCSFDGCGHRAPNPGDGNQRVTLRVEDADNCAVVDNVITACDWGILFRGSTATPGISGFDCRGNTVVHASPAIATSQGVSSRFGRRGRIEGNSIAGFDDNSIDCNGCNNMIIAGNSTSGGKDGVFLGDENTSSVTVSGNVFTGPQRGVRIQTSFDPALNNRLVASVTVVGNVVSAPTDGGILVFRAQGDDPGTPAVEAAATQISGITISGNSVHGPAIGNYGIKLVGADSSKVIGNQIYRIGGPGVALEKTDLVEVAGNIIQDAGHTRPANSVDAISVLNANRAFVRDNTAYGTARYAVAVTGGVGMTVTGNRWRSLATGGVNNGATGTTLADNLGL
ncbi:right-handed parallel beta-helix repeat-containing protein [Hamadaea tsunoensis]|uniref:right-handed parallel beta-helix repeat-containing protein n=1 Tax=Hamadaea tsunoensis TaxID=53368 RepID=UPI0012F831A1|nr:right-handed parallel beta-helix repeat-containing protein [Hamadaea tsunoensis]